MRHALFVSKDSGFLPPQSKAARAVG